MRPGIKGKGHAPKTEVCDPGSEQCWISAVLSLLLMETEIRTKFHLGLLLFLRILNSFTSSKHDYRCYKLLLTYMLYIASLLIIIIIT